MTSIFYTDLSQCRECLKARYLGDKAHRQTRWDKLKRQVDYIDVTVIRSNVLSSNLREEHAMGLQNGQVGKRQLESVSVDQLLNTGYGKVVLIEGDPGAGKTTMTFHICKEWATGNLLENELVFWVPLRFYKSVTSIDELFDKFSCPKMKEYSMEYNGKNLVFIFDGWDELPDSLQSSSLYQEVIFGDSRLVHSTIIVTSRPSCSSEIAARVHNSRCHFQILGFSPEMVTDYVQRFFAKDSLSSKSLLDFLKERENLRRHFYIPSTVAIMCFVYQSNGNKIPETLSQLYMQFVLLYLRLHIPDTLWKRKKRLKSFDDIPKEVSPLFLKFCKLALDLLKKDQLMFGEDEMGQMNITDDDLTCFELKNEEQFDGFGMLQIHHSIDYLACEERSYSFIHRAVQELLAAISLWKSNCIEDMIDTHFKPGSYLLNVFPFAFGLVSIHSRDLRPLADKLVQTFERSRRNRKLLSSILYCLFEAQDEMLCQQFAQVYNEDKEVNLQLATLLEYRYAAYFLSVCHGNKLNIDLSHSTELVDLHADVMSQHLCNTTTDISSVKCLVQLSAQGMDHFAKLLSHQPNLSSVKLYSIGSHGAGCVKILCDSIRRWNPQLVDLDLPYAELDQGDLDSLGHLLATPLEGLHLNECSPHQGISLTSSQLFCEGMCKAKSLKYFCMGTWTLSLPESDTFGDILSRNASLKEIDGLQVTSADCLGPILKGLSFNTMVKLLKAWPKTVGSSNTLGKYLKKCLTSNQSLTSIDFGYYSDKYVAWSSLQVAFICAGLHGNISLVTLDISGSSLDNVASNAICEMLALNKTLTNLFINPVELQLPEAMAVIQCCKANLILEILSLVQWPGGKYEFSTDEQIVNTLQEVEKLRMEKNKKLLQVYWLVN